MKYPDLLRAAVLATTLGAGSVLAQTGPVVTDAAPPPAEERSSSGAIVLENSLVRAQRDSAFERSAARTGVSSIGRGVLRSTMRGKTPADVAQARVDRALELQNRGAASRDQK